MSDSRITDDAVEHAYRAFWQAQKDQNVVPVRQRTGPHEWMRLALEAALPHLAPQPVVDREAVADLLANLHASRDGLSNPEMVWNYMQDARDEADAVLALLNGTAK